MIDQRGAGDAHPPTQGGHTPESIDDLTRAIRLNEAKLAKRVEDLHSLRRIWARIPWLWASLVTVIPLGVVLGIWGIFIGIGLALSLVGVAYYITYAHVSQHEMEVGDISAHLKELKATLAARDGASPSPAPTPAEGQDPGGDTDEPTGPVLI